MFSRHTVKGAVKGRPGLTGATYTGHISRGRNYWVVRLIIAVFSVGGLLLIIFGLKSILFAEKITPLISLEVSSDPPGASISLNGKKVGTTTPGLVLLNEG